MTEEEYFCYFEDKGKAFIIEIKDLKIFAEPVDPYTTFGEVIPPQSFCYVNENFLFEKERTTICHNWMIYPELNYIISIFLKLR